MALRGSRLPRRLSALRLAKGEIMASDITLAVGDGARRMTYADLAQARSISLASARRSEERRVGKEC